PSADGGKGSALDPPAFFYEKKAGRKNLSCPWQAPIGRATPQILIYRNEKGGLLPPFSLVCLPSWGFVVYHGVLFCLFFLFISTFFSPMLI
ncbi:MAG: hypothetical protein IJM32_05835, partial [Ruminococcus sp.]|nr:hypothetical protein [Ruminococcus sp.]